MPYEWSQTKEDLTLQVPFPPSTPASSIVCTVSQGRLVVGLRGEAPIVDGELFDPLSSHVWSLEGGNRLTLELEKARPRYWPWVLRGDPEIDVAALKARDKLESEPAYKPHPDADSMPRRVTDRATLRKLKAEMPELNIPGVGDVGGVANVEHKNYSGPRKQFSWGAIPATSPPTYNWGPVAAVAAVAAACPVSEARPARRARLEAEVTATRAKLRGLEEQLRELCEAE